jgi:hypothetical protein
LFVITLHSSLLIFEGLVALVVTFTQVYEQDFWDLKRRILSWKDMSKKL